MRAKVTRQIQMDPDLYARLEAYARARGVSINRALSEAVAYFLEHHAQRREAQGDGHSQEG